MNLDTLVEKQLGQLVLQVLRQQHQINELTEQLAKERSHAERVSTDSSSPIPQRSHDNG